TLPATIGRAYSNEIIVDDQYVCPEHLRLSQSEGGDIVVEDLGSVNGSFQLEPPGCVKSKVLKSGETLRIGQTMLRFFLPAHYVPPSVRTHIRDVRIDRFRTAFLVVAVYLGIEFEKWYFLENYRVFTRGEYLVWFAVVGIACLVLLSVWAGLWAAFSRMIR